jgi:molybdopterin-guanine dinucleotide biosynthesis protein A
MGRDKAFLPLPNSDLLLWQHQWRILEELLPEEILWSGPSRPELPANVRVIPDALPSAGPLGGLSACLDIVCTDLLVVLAVDLPQMPSVFLRNLLPLCSTNCGVVARNGDFFEPLAAIYPTQLRELAASHLAQDRYAMQDLVREAIQQNLLQEIPLEKKDVELFKNLNRPSDMTDLYPHSLV